MKTNNPTTITAEPGALDLTITREFDAPPDLVYRAHTDPDLFVQWLGPRDLETRLETFEPESGGRWRYISIDKDGNEYGFHGVFHEVSPTRLIQTFEFEGLPEAGHVVLDAMQLEELSGRRTRLTIHSIYLSVEDRDGMVQAGMESGVVDGYERLDELLERMPVE